MKIFLIGGTGFIGHAVARFFSENKIETVILTRNLCSQIDRLQGIKYVVGDWQDQKTLNAYIDSTFTHVVHLVSTTVPATAENDIKNDITSNLLSSIQLFEHCGNVGVKKIIFPSSGGTIYGPLNTVSSEFSATNPICSYGIVKLAIEKYLQYFARKYQFDFVILRVANPFGPYQKIGKEQGIIATFMSKILNGEKINVFGSGNTVRDFVYISDVAAAFYKASIISGSGVFNIGSGRGVSIIELIKSIESILNIQAEVQFLKAREFDVPGVVLNCSLAKSELNWEPEIDFDEGLFRTIAWYKSNHEFY